MHIVQVQVHVKPEFVEPFIEATLANASSSVSEPGIVRFDFLQVASDPTRFILNEVYRTKDAQTAHRETAHYLRWRDAVADMMAEPRVPTTLVNLFPADETF